MRNIEAKARLHDRDAALAVCATLGAAPQGDIHQIDTYFNVPSGRFKLREAQPGRTELVFYHRPDTEGPKGCDYSQQMADPAIKAILTEALGVLTVVDKVRTLYLWHNVRIHLDIVKGLGNFIEFEAVMSKDQDDAEGYARLDEMILAFDVKHVDMVRVSYLELMVEHTPKPHVE